MREAIKTGLSVEQADRGIVTYQQKDVLQNSCNTSLLYLYSAYVGAIIDRPRDDVGIVPYFSFCTALSFSSTTGAMVTCFVPDFPSIWLASIWILRSLSSSTDCRTVASLGTV